MKKLFLGALCALSLLSAPASAATLGVFTKDYANGDVPVSGGTATAAGWEVSDTFGAPFLDVFDFSSLSYSSIDSLVLTLNYGGAGPNSVFFGLIGENWNVRVGGSDTASTFDDFTGQLDDSTAPTSFTMDASTDVGGVDAFVTAVVSQSLSFSFDNTFTSLLPESFVLASATLTVNGTSAVVPLPAPVWLLLTALGGLVAMRRRQASPQT